MSERTDALLAQLTAAEKVELVTGRDMWHTRAVERLGIGSMKVTDGPNGARGDGLMGTGTATACIPSGSMLGATWDPDLVEELGGLLGDESRAKGAHVLLAPTINLHRSPKGGRNFECYAEDPLLTGRLAAAFVRGVQSRGVATTAKHFVANDSEFERNTIDVRVDERTLREVYLLPFELAVKEADAWGIMSAYNRLNGTFCSEHEWLLTTVLRDEWGFDGFVVSDWFAARSTAGSAMAGLSLEMPGEGTYYGPQLREALDAGEVDEATIDRLVSDMLVVLERTGALDADGDPEEKPLDRPEDRALARRAAVAGTVLLRNDGVLPLDPASVSTVAVIGPNGHHARVMGGGSAKVRAYRATSPLDALTDRLGAAVEVRYEKGCDIDRTTPALSRPALSGDATVEFFAGHEIGGEPAATSTLGAMSLLAFGEPAAGVSAEAYSARVTGTVIPTVSGTHELRLVQAGRARVLVDGEVALDGTEGEYERGSDFFGMGSVEIVAAVELTADRPTEIVVEFDNRDAILLTGFRLGLVSMVEEDLLGRAVALAGEADVAVVVVGTNDDWETEGRDRDLWELPGDQPELIRRVAAVNDRTVVVVNAGAVHDMSWLEDPAAVLSVGFGGQELGDALVDVLLGDADPGGRMPTTVPAAYEQFAAYPNYPGDNSAVRYGEGVFVGHRWHDTMGIEPAVPFGSGLSYTTFSIDGPRVADTAATGETVTVEVEVTNTGERRGSEVVQLYVEPIAPALVRPRRELKGFAKVELDPGESRTVSVHLDGRSFAYFDPADRDWERISALSIVPAEGGGLHRTEPGWWVDPGAYGVVVGRSSRDEAGRATITLLGEAVRLPL